VSRTLAGALLLACLLLVSPALAQPTVDVTFQVDMSYQADLGNFLPEVHQAVVMASFTQFNPEQGLMSFNEAEACYVFTSPLRQYSSENYFFAIYNPATQEVVAETIPQRRVETQDQPMILDIVWFSDQEPGSVDYVDVLVSFSIDLANLIDQEEFDPSTDQIILRGSRPQLGNWTGSDVQLTNMDGWIFSADVLFEEYLAGEGTQYKYVILPDGDEEQPIWEADPNRSFVVTGTEPDNNEDGVLELVIPTTSFNAEAAPMFPVTFRVVMSRQADLGTFDPSSDQVCLLGNFNGYTPGANMLELSEEGYYQTILFFPSHYSGQYQFAIMRAIGGVMQEIRPRILEVYDDPLTLPVVWFNDDTGGGGQEYQTTAVGFLVEMGDWLAEGQFDPETDEVVLQGDGPELGDWGRLFHVQMELDEGEHGYTCLYTAGILFEDFPIGQSRGYKFGIIRQDDEIWEAGLRTFTINGSEPYDDDGGFHHLILPVAHFNESGGGEDLTDQDVTVTFHVDMRPLFNRLADPEAPPLIAPSGMPITSVEEVGWVGSFNSWPYDNVPLEYQLTDDGTGPDLVADDQIYAITLVFPAGTPRPQDYKYSVNGQDVEAGFQENHWMQLDDGTGEMTIYDLFGSTADWYDPWIPQLYDNFEVHIDVLMTPILESGNFDMDTLVVAVRGSVPDLGNWLEGESVMLLPDDRYEDIWFGVVPIDNLPVGAVVEYKFVLESAADRSVVLWEEGVNRTFQITGSEIDQDENGRKEVHRPLAQFRYVPPIALTPIYDIQYVPNPVVNDASPMVGQTVTVQGWVTFDARSGDNIRFFMADGPGAWNGIYVYVPSSVGSHRLGVGVEVRVTGVVAEYFGLTEINVENGSHIEIVNPSIHWDDPPPPLAVQYTDVPIEALQDPATAEAFESVLIRVHNVATQGGPDEGGEWVVGDGSGNTLIIDNPFSEMFGYRHLVTPGQPFVHVQGPLHYTYGAYKLLPEIAYDLKVSVNRDAGWFTSIPYIQQVKYHDITVHRGEGVPEYRNDQSYASGQRYNDSQRSEDVTVWGIVTMEPGVGSAEEGCAKFLITDYFVGLNDSNQLAEWGSILVYTHDAAGLPTISVGDMVIVQGTVSESASGPSHHTQINVIAEYGYVDNIGTYEGDWYPYQTPTGTLWSYWEAERFESALVTIPGGVVVENELEDPSMQLLLYHESSPVSVMIGADSAPFRAPGYTPPPLGTEITSLTGWINNVAGMLTPMEDSDGIFRLEPRYLSDMVYEVVHQAHFTSVPPTGLPYAVVVASAAFGEGALTPGDEIALFDGDLCVGSAIVEGYPVSITAWQGDPGQGLAGFTTGHPIVFRVWVPAEQREYPAEASYIAGDGTFGYGFGSNVDLEVQLESTLIFPLAGGRYELVSTPMMPADLAVTSVFGVLPGLQIVYEDNGDFYWPTAGVDNIGTIDVTEGYRLFLASGQELTLTGVPLDPSTTYHLMDNRWNWMGYPFMDERPVSGALSPIMEQLIIVLDDDGAVFWPGAGVYTLGSLVPGTGYQIFVTDEVEFEFGLPMPAKTEMALTEITLLPDAPTPTGLPYPVLVSWDEALESQGVAAVELYAGDLLVGKGAPIGDRSAAYITAWGGDEATGLAGFAPGQQIRVRLLGEADEPLRLKSEMTGTRYGEGPGAQIAVEHLELPTDFSVGAGYPNPFNPAITIPFGLPEGGEVSFTLFNLLGQRVAKESMTLQAGYHRHVLMAQPGMVSGVYFLRVEYGQASKLQKIMLLK